MRRLLVAGNWKMHGSQTMTTELIAGLTNELDIGVDEQLGYDILLCPTSTYLLMANVMLENLPISLGAQNVSEHDSGAYTGEISLEMLDDVGCSYVLLGHSERRELFAEIDQVVANKFAACVQSDSNITPILCVGETLSDRQSGQTETIVARQLDAVLDKVGIAGFNNAVIAYEPVWAIGTGETATPQQAQDVHAFIRKKLADLDAEIADKIRILYGGSVKPDNAQELFNAPDIDGGLVGGASLDAKSFAGICEAANVLSST